MTENTIKYIFSEPISSALELYKEGEEMENCLMKMIENVSKFKGTYFYRILKPERATIRIVKGVNGAWIINEIRGRSNSEIKNNEFWKMILKFAETPNLSLIGSFPGKSRLK